MKFVSEMDGHIHLIQKVFILRFDPLKPCLFSVKPAEAQCLLFYFSCIRPFLIYSHSCIFVSGIYRLALSHERLGISREKLATRVLPHVIPLSIEGTLNLKQYNAYASLIRDMCSQLEREQCAKLEQVHGASEEPKWVWSGFLWGFLFFPINHAFTFSQASHSIIRFCYVTYCEFLWQSSSISTVPIHELHSIHSSFRPRWLFIHFTNLTITFDY